MKFFDTHAHLDSEQLHSELSHYIQLAREANLVGIVAIGTTVASSHRCLQIAEAHDFVYAAVGIHPNQCSEVNRSDWAEIEKLIQHPKAVAIGETGLDRYWDYCPIEVQREWFDKHIQLSQKTQKPLVIHMRECEAYILDSLRPYGESGPIKGIMHSYAGSPETADQCVEWGMHVSFAGMVTFKKSDELRTIAKTIPTDRILIETDSPYLTPHPKRGKRPNHPALVRHTAECLAESRGESLEDFCASTTENAMRLFGIK